eukprot:7305996-Prymnesium_polylepis.1
MGEVQARSSFRGHVPPIPAKNVTRARARALSRPLSPPYALRAVPRPKPTRRTQATRVTRSSVTWQAPGP